MTEFVTRQDLAGLADVVAEPHVLVDESRPVAPAAALLFVLFFRGMVRRIAGGSDGNRR